ncbi:MAG: cyclic nucleotide-binding domain-containing protein [Thermoanaerobaculia bacterium]|nr:cyclic nucleotide-binding domain-containing protein [Thermoanaerobaculia bacterium]
MGLASRLAQLALFAHFREPELEALAACAVGRAYEPQASILRQGEPTLDIYVVDRGLVDIQRTTPYGQFTLAQLGAGQLFGETSFVDSATRSGDVVAHTQSALVALLATPTLALLERDQRVAVALYWAFWKSLSAKLRSTNDQLGRFFSQNPRSAGDKPPLAKSTTGEFRLDIAAKRSLFAEQKLSSLEINFLTSLSRERKLKSGQILFHEGDPGDAMYVVLEGRVLISKFIPGAGEEALAFLERGDYFGEMALIDRAPRSAQARAHDGGAVVLAIPAEVVAGILDVRKISSLPLLKILCGLVAKRLREVDDKIVGWYILSGGESNQPG